jgi:SAM-dependent methyltransferase
MNPRRIAIVVLLLGLGMLLGGLIVTFSSPRKGVSPKLEQKAWPPAEFTRSSGWVYLKVDESGWSTGPAGSFQDLDHRLANLAYAEKEIVIPIFPTVYAPKMEDKIYYDAILESDMKPGDKVLVIGTGSGADAWMAALKSKAPVYVVEINPMAIVNARATARMARFQIKAVAGDITSIGLPEDFRDFDFVLWNMPFVWEKALIEANKKFEDNSFHDGDDGTLLKRFLTMLPSLLKKGGTAILLNGHPAKKIITIPGAAKKADEKCVLFVIPNP